MSAEPFPFRSEIADVAATMGQAEAVLELIGSYGDEPPTVCGAIHGAATIIRAALDQLGKIELAADFAPKVQS